MASTDGKQKKRHHYIPITYLNHFADATGRIYAYRKDDVSKPLYLKPDQIAFERYYYSQPLPDGGRDNNKLEAFFSRTYESTWPALVHRLEKRSNVPSDFEDLLGFIIAMRVRVPATRDFVELMLAERIKLEVHALDQKGILPPKPAGHEDIRHLSL